MKLKKKEIEATLKERAKKAVLLKKKQPIVEAVDKKVVGAIFKELATMFSKTAGDEKAAQYVVDKIKKAHMKKNPEETKEVVEKFLN